jgi:parallel beta-helix repeat protein
MIAASHCEAAISAPATTARAAAKTSVSITDFGAKSDGKTDCALAFQKAFTSGARTVVVPAGRFVVSRIALPAGVVLQGEGARSSLAPAATAQSPLIALGADSQVRDLKFAGGKAKITCLRSGAVSGVSIENVSIEDFDGVAIESDHTRGLMIRGCTMRKVRRATNLVFSNRVQVLDNTVEDCSEHGLQFWGNWNWEKRDSSELRFSGNTITNGGAGAIWGAGATKVIVSGNTIDGAEDVGIDLEWCQDATITGNIVQRAKNGGIALFFSCERVAIAGNSIFNSRVVSDEEAKADWWARAGIWLTYPNTKDFPGDLGHRNISITGNTIACEPGTAPRRAMWIGSGSDNITLSGNSISGGAIWEGGGEEALREIAPESAVTLHHK